MFRSNFVLSKVLFVIFVNKQFLSTDTAPSARNVDSTYFLGHFHRHSRMCDHPVSSAILFRDSEENSEIVDKEEDNIVISTTPGTTTVTSGEEPVTLVPYPSVRLRTIFGVVQNCKQGERRDRKGRCRRVISV